MLKTIKGKVIAGTVSVVLLSSAGAAFANSNAGAKFGDWYDGQYGKAAGSVSTQSYGYANGKVGALVAEYNGLKSDATASINGTRDSSTNRVNNAITTEKQAHIDAINSQKTAISGYMATQFNGLSTFADGLIDQAGVDATAYANQNLGAHATTEGGNAVAKVSTDLNDASAAAVTELQTAISTAQGELNTQLRRETNATVDEIKAMIDAKIVELRGTITQIKNDLVLAQQTLINAEAGRQLNDAKVDLQAVVDGI
jgi:hypothetical protein